MDDHDPNDPWSDLPPRKRWGPAIVLLLLAAAGVGITLFILNNNPPAAGLDVQATEGRLTLAEDDGKSLAVVDRQLSPEIWYRVTLADAPVGETLSLTCEWVSPTGSVVHRNKYPTKPIDRANWPTHARCRFNPDSPVGSWTVRLKLRDRVLHTTAFEVQDGGKPAKGAP